MEIRYNALGKERKRLAEVIAKEIGVDARYKGVPTCAYEADYFTIDKDGTLIFEDEPGSDEIERVLRAVRDAGFEAETDDDKAEDDPETEAEPEDNEPVRLTIQVPMMTGDEISRLESLIESKETLLKKAIGTDNLIIEDEGDKLSFPWFDLTDDPDESTAYTQLVTALCSMAKKAKRINAKDHEVENEKYAFRCFLLRLGFIGDEYKASRKVLLRNFSGSSAFKDGRKSDEISE